MNVKVQLVIEDGVEQEALVKEVASFSRQTLTSETLGLTLEEAKTLLVQVQETMVREQVVTYLDQQRTCVECGRRRARKGQHTIVYRTLFGTLHLPSPRTIPVAVKTISLSRKGAGVPSVWCSPSEQHQNYSIWRPNGLL